MTERLLLRPEEAATAIGISRAKCYELLSRGELPSVRIGSSIRVPVEALRRWIESQLSDRQVTTTEPRSVLWEGGYLGPARCLGAY